ncbi:hypothetical protein K402DRAFT_454005 [Aulographum hederae CBS 113979]|uniref:L-ornithine N(5)-oxygenase n=1 Tax=Aulographum hederae CBS 113979 TaxID=1176131 RepID=A0A6G1H136_9PEZI|nr:hypothetical protein K402DRAFT_454005 [Aulographum hederae CBS 113979]
MAPSLPDCVDTVIIGNGPSALILSYILHGHIPYYKGTHHDPVLHAKVSRRPNFLDLTPDLYAHFQSSLRYSTQALPVNTLLDTLLRPNADTEVNPTSCIEWRYEPERAVSHIALGHSPRTGGQWTSNPVSASWDIGTLSYAEMLSLPGYSYTEHYLKVHGAALQEFQRPSRAEVAEYYATYPSAAGISEANLSSVEVGNISRTETGFRVSPQKIDCKHLVLASGIFSHVIPPPRLLTPLATLDSSNEPLLVIGSGFSAADVIISAPANRKIIHLFNWRPDERPSPLRGCHHQAYPEYAGVYRQMKLAAMSSGRPKPAVSPFSRRKSNPFFSSRDWNAMYEGYPNATVLEVFQLDGQWATIKLRLEGGDVVERRVGGMSYVVGRRGTLSYLSKDILRDVLGADPETPNALVSGRTLRPKAEVDTEVAEDVFIIGSLTGDSLVRHAFGGCVFAAGKIIADASGSVRTSPRSSVSPTPPGTPGGSSRTSSAMNGHGHDDLHLDRRKLAERRG